jgi:hypothetical protein
LRQKARRSHADPHFVTRPFLAQTCHRFLKYNGALRAASRAGQVGYVTTIHAINSMIIKASKLTAVARVYRGVSGGVLPETFRTPNEQGVRGGVERAFVSTSRSREEAKRFATATGQAAMIFEIQMGMIDRGCDVASISQYPREEECLFAPLTAFALLHTRVDGPVLIAEVRLSVNLKAFTLDLLRKKCHAVMTSNEIDDTDRLDSVVNGSDSLTMHDNAPRFLKRAIAFCLDRNLVVVWRGPDEKRAVVNSRHSSEPPKMITVAKLTDRMKGNEDAYSVIERLPGAASPPFKVWSRKERGVSLAELDIIAAAPAPRAAAPPAPAASPPDPEAPSAAAAPPPAPAAAPPPAAAGMLFQIYVRPALGSLLSLQVAGRTTVAELASLLQARREMPLSSWALARRLHSGPMHLERSISSYGVREGSVVHMLLRGGLRGGSKRALIDGMPGGKQSAHGTSRHKQPRALSSDQSSQPAPGASNTTQPGSPTSGARPVHAAEVAHPDKVDRPSALSFERLQAMDPKVFSEKCESMFEVRLPIEAYNVPAGKIKLTLEENSDAGKTTACYHGREKIDVELLGIGLTNQVLTSIQQLLKHTILSSVALETLVDDDDEPDEQYLILAFSCSAGMSYKKMNEKMHEHVVLVMAKWALSAASSYTPNTYGSLLRSEASERHTMQQRRSIHAFMKELTGSPDAVDTDALGNQLEQKGWVKPHGMYNFQLKQLKKMYDLEEDMQYRGGCAAPLPCARDIVPCTGHGVRCCCTLRFHGSQVARGRDGNGQDTCGHRTCVDAPGLGQQQVPANRPFVSAR